MEKAEQHTQNEYVCNADMEFGWIDLSSQKYQRRMTNVVMTTLKACILPHQGKGGQNGKDNL